MYCKDNYKNVLKYIEKRHTEENLNHSILVTKEIIDSCVESKLEDEKSNLAITCALLHNSIETQITTYDKLYNDFNDEIAEAVESLTINKSLEKQEQLRDYIEKVMNQPYEVQMVVLANKIVLLNKILDSQDKDVNSFVKDTKFILSCLRNCDIYLSVKLEESLKLLQK